MSCGKVEKAEREREEEEEEEEAEEVEEKGDTHWLAKTVGQLLTKLMAQDSHKREMFDLCNLLTLF